MMAKLRSTCDGRLICQTSQEERNVFFVFLGTTYLQNRNVHAVGDSVRMLLHYLVKH